MNMEKVIYVDNLVLLTCICSSYIDSSTNFLIQAFRDCLLCFLVLIKTILYDLSTCGFKCWRLSKQNRKREKKTRVDDIMNSKKRTDWIQPTINLFYIFIEKEKKKTRREKAEKLLRSSLWSYLFVKERSFQTVKLNKVRKPCTYMSNLNWSMFLFWTVIVQNVSRFFLFLVLYENRNHIKKNNSTGYIILYLRWNRRFLSLSISSCGLVHFHTFV